MKKFNILKLGILYNKGIAVNHRSLKKVILNPILRYFGYCIGSEFIDEKFVKYHLFKCERSKKIKYTMSTNEYDTIKIAHII